MLYITLPYIQVNTYLCDVSTILLIILSLSSDQDELIIGKIRFKTFDLGGHETGKNYLFSLLVRLSLITIIARKLWRDYFASGVDGVVFIVDAVDRARFPEAKKELDALLVSEELANVPFLVLGNKIDLGTAPSEEDLRYQLGLYETYGKENKGERNPNIRPIELYMCSVVRKMGYGDGKYTHAVLVISYVFDILLNRF